MKLCPPKLDFNLCFPMFKGMVINNVRRIRNINKLESTDIIFLSKRVFMLTKVNCDKARAIKIKKVVLA